MQDAVFIQGHDGLMEIASLSSISVNEPLPYQGYSLDLVRFDELSVVRVFGTKSVLN